MKKICWNRHGVTIITRHAPQLTIWCFAWSLGGVVSRNVNHGDGRMSWVVFAPFAWIWKQGPFFERRMVGTSLHQS